MQTASAIATVLEPIIDPNSLKIIALKLAGPMIGRSKTNLVSTDSIREYSHLGMIIDNLDELVASDDIIKLKKVLELHFNIIGLKVESKKGSKLGKVIDYTFSPEDFSIKQIIVKRPLLKSFTDSELTIPRKEIIKITDDKIIIKDEESTIRARAENEDFVPNFVNPFRKTEQGYAPIQTKTPDDKDS